MPLLNEAKRIAGKRPSHSGLANATKAFPTERASRPSAMSYPTSRQRMRSRSRPWTASLRSPPTRRLWPRRFPMPPGRWMRLFNRRLEPLTGIVPRFRRPRFRHKLRAGRYGYGCERLEHDGVDGLLLIDQTSAVLDDLKTRRSGFRPMRCAKPTSCFRGSKATSIP